MGRNPRKPQEQLWHAVPFYADISGLSVDTIRGFIASGHLKAFDARRPGATRHAWKIHEADWQAFVDSRSNAAPEPPPRRRKNFGTVKEFV